MSCYMHQKDLEQSYIRSESSAAALSRCCETLIQLHHMLRSSMLLSASFSFDSSESSLQYDALSYEVLPELSYSHQAIYQFGTRMSSSSVSVLSGPLSLRHSI
jgi:hypothetical protein